MSNEFMNIKLDSDIAEKIALGDVTALEEAEKSYGDSWKRRGGTDSFMMLARKWDRIENQCRKHNFNILTACSVDQRAEGIIDDIRDLRRYLVLVEQEMIQRGGAIPEIPKGEGEAGSGYVDQDKS